jgi:uncharacterized protein (DUF488 family)
MFKIMIKLYTIGFAGKSAEKFFTLLRNAGVRKILDIRINNTSQLAGFARQTDLKFFAKEIGNISYEHFSEAAPSKDLFTRARNKKINWQEYKTEYMNLIEERKVAEKIYFEDLHESCLLCSEHLPDQCHRKLLAVYLKRINPHIEVIHLID